MPINLFGFTISKNQTPSEPGVNNVVAPDSYDGSFQLDSGSLYGGFMSSYADFTGSAKSEQEFIKRYRSMALFPEVDMAIEYIANDAIVQEVDHQPIKIDLEDTNLPPQPRGMLEAGDAASKVREAQDRARRGETTSMLDVQPQTI